MATSKKTQKESQATLQLESLNRLITAYGSVIADFTQDIGWPVRFQKKVLRALEQREYELDHVWREIYEAELDAEEEYNKK